MKGTVTVPLDLKIRGRYCSNRLFSRQYSSSRVSQRYGTSSLDCMNHRHGTPQNRSTGQMKYRGEALTSKLSMKTLIKWAVTLPRKYFKDFVYKLSPKKHTLISWDCPWNTMHVSAPSALPAVTLSKQWIHFLRSDLWPPTSTSSNRRPST